MKVRVCLVLASGTLVVQRTLAFWPAFLWCSMQQRTTVTTHSRRDLAKYFREAGARRNERHDNRRDASASSDVNNHFKARRSSLTGAISWLSRELPVCASEGAANMLVAGAAISSSTPSNRPAPSESRFQRARRRGLGTSLFAIATADDFSKPERRGGASALPASVVTRSGITREHIHPARLRGS